MIMRHITGPVLMLAIAVSMALADVTVTVTPWKPAANISGGTMAVAFSGAFPDKVTCETYVKTQGFKTVYASILVFLASHTGQKLGPPYCLQVPVVPDAPGIKGESI